MCLKTIIPIRQSIKNKREEIKIKVETDLEKKKKIDHLGPSHEETK